MFMQTHSLSSAKKTHHRHAVRIQKTFYTILFLLLGFSLLAFFLPLWEPSLRLWEYYYGIYLIIALSYTWYIFLLLFYGDIQKKSHPNYAGEKISVIVPCYNEAPKLLQACLESIVNAEGEKEIIVVDDGSTNGIHKSLSRIGKKHGIIVHFFDRNKGKRAAIHYAVRNLIGRSKYIVTIDSDTIIDKHALVRVVGPLKKKGVAGASGDIRLLNEKQNLLTRMIGGYYWSALHVHRKAESAVGMVTCCSGALSAYRSSALRKVISSFVRQEFFGKRCTHSEDRHLTNLMHKQNYKVVFVPEAIAYTHSPSTLRGFLTQQQRWRRGFIQEALFALSFAWKNKPLLFFQIFVWDLMMPFFSLGIFFFLITVAVSNPLRFFVILLPWLLFVSLLKNLPAFFEARRKLPGLFLFSIFSIFVTQAQGVYALFTVKNKNWITR